MKSFDTYMGHSFLVDVQESKMELTIFSDNSSALPIYQETQKCHADSEQRFKDLAQIAKQKAQQYINTLNNG